MRPRMRFARGAGKTYGLEKFRNGKMEIRKNIKNQELTEIIVSTKELSRILGVGYQRVHVLARKGILKKIEAGRYDLIHSIQGYIAFLKRHCYKILPWQGVK